jgi:hypothetical protein
VPPPDPRRREIPSSIIRSDNASYKRMHTERFAFPMQETILFARKVTGYAIAQAARAERSTTSISSRTFRLTWVEFSQNGARHSTSNNSAPGS